MMKIQPIKFPPFPRSITGLKNDGTKDKRYKAGKTMVELEEYMEMASGTSELSQ